MVRWSRRRRLLGGALVCLAALISTALSLEFALSVKLLIDTLTVGISNTKTYLFLAYLGCCLALLATSEEHGSGATGSLRRLGGLILVLHLIVVAEQLSFSERLGTPVRTPLLVYQDYDYAKTSLAHVHVGKAVLGQWFAGANHTFDGGTAFLPFFPRGWLIFHFLLLSATGLFALRAVHRELPGFAKWEQAMILLCLFILLETTIDGGPLSSQGIVAGLLYLALVFRWPRARLMVVGLSLMLLMIWATWPLVGENLLRSGTALLVIGLLGFCFYTTRRSLQIVSLFGVVLTAVGSGWLLNLVSPRVQAVGTGYNTVLYGMTTLVPNQAFHVTSLSSLVAQEDHEALGEETVGPFFVTKLRTKKATTILAVCRAYSLNMARKPVTTYPGPRRLKAVKLTEAGSESVLLAAPLGANINAAAAVLGPDRQILSNLYLQDVSRVRGNSSRQ